MAAVRLAAGIAEARPESVAAWLGLCDDGDGRPVDDRLARERALTAKVEAEARRALQTRPAKGTVNDANEAGGA